MRVSVEVEVEDERPGGVRGGEGDLVVVREGSKKGSKIDGWRISNGSVYSFSALDADVFSLGEREVESAV